MHNDGLFFDCILRDVDQRVKDGCVVFVFVFLLELYFMQIFVDQRVKDGLQPRLVKHHGAVLHLTVSRC